VTVTRQPEQRGPVNIGCPRQAPVTVLQDHPVDVLIVESSEDDSTSGTKRGSRYWEQWLVSCTEPSRPDLVVVCADSEELVKDGGFHSKMWRRKCHALGYEPGFWYMKATEHGGVVRQDRLILLLQKTSSTRPRLTTQPPREDPRTKPRSAGNMLKNHQIPPSAWDRKGWKEYSVPTMISKAAAPCKILGATKNRQPVFCPSAALPDGTGAWIRVTDHRKKQRVRRLLTEELAKAKGMPLEWLAGDQGDSAMVDSLTAIHLWAAIGDTVHESWTKTVSAVQEDMEAVPTAILTSWLDKEELPQDTTDVFEWQPPDLSEGGEWYLERVASLEKAIAGHPEADHLHREGLEALARHRQNYGPEGPRVLQLLWWEFPKEHWSELRDGCPMNFLTEPTGEVMSNPVMDEEELKIAAEFVDELKRLGVLRRLPPGQELRANAPLFCVPKPGQDGQWRPIADMKRGGQNEHIGKDPVHLPRSDDILPRMYTGGWTAVADLSKFFYNFPTHPDDRLFLGCIHPTTGEHLCYFGLPMGSGSSPGLAGRYGASLLRQVREREAVFQGLITNNGWRVHYEDGNFDPRRGIGLVVMGEDGLPAALMWIHVDDIAVHAPTKVKCQAALTALMDATVRVGLICQPCKTRAPAQVQKYCGFIYDTVGIPCLRAPQDKLDRALATIAYLRAGTTTWRLSRLTLAVVVGLLQSLVEATPYNMGQTYLRRLYDRLHLFEGDRRELSAANFYYTQVELTAEEWLDLDWWENAVRTGLQRYVRSQHLDRIGVTWGDGSGTGTGGTVQIVPRGDGDVAIEAWMGVWEPQVFHFTSNWKELRTLVHTLEQEKSTRLKGCTVFYFTDNSTTYYIAHKGSSKIEELHKLVRRLKELELALDIHLEVVHVPGRHMISQQTDGLSRGISFSASRSVRSPQEEVLRLFRGVSYSVGLIPWLMQVSGRSWWSSFPLTYVDCQSRWTFAEVAGHASVWLPDPEWADQVISAVLDVWIEQPWHTEAFFVVPRIFQRRWGRKSKHLTEILLAKNPLSVPGAQESDIPIVVLHLPCYVRSLPPPSSSRLDEPAKPTWADWHLEQADYVRGL